MKRRRSVKGAWPSYTGSMRLEHLESEEALTGFLRGFEEGTLPKAEWTHGAHVAAAAYYLRTALGADTKDAEIPQLPAEDVGRYGAPRLAGLDNLSRSAFDAAYDTILPVMRQRIQSYNLAVGGANTATSGYHETLTRFWLRIVVAHLREAPDLSPWQAARRAVAEFGEKRALHADYYSGDVVKDSAARLGWREPDLRPLP